MLLRVFKASIALSAFALVSGPAMASHHFESAIAQRTPALNQLDNYVFPSFNPHHTALVMTVNPAPKAGANQTFASDALYNIHVSDDASYKTGHTFSFAFNGRNKFTLYKSDSPNAAVGEMGAKIGGGEVGKVVDLSGGIRVWTGVAKDPFYGNSTSLGLLHAQLDSGKPYDPTIWAQAKGKSIFIGRKVGAMVLEVPDSMLGSTVRVFMTTAVKKDGTWQQVQYSANPLLSHIMLFENEALTAEHDRSRPDTGNAIKPIVSARTARAAALAKSNAEPQQYGDQVANMLVPDVLTYKVGSPASYTATARNGRSLDDDAMSTMLTLLLGKPTNQEIANPKLHTDAFPYLIPASAD